MRCDLALCLRTDVAHLTAAVSETATPGAYLPLNYDGGLYFSSCNSVAAWRVYIRCVNYQTISRRCRTARGGTLYPRFNRLRLRWPIRNTLRPNAPTAPLSAYGRTKLAGEKVIGAYGLIVRTASIYRLNGSNFVRTMLSLMAEREEVRAVADQIGTPTNAPALWTMATQGT
jgi:hypothetical protein